ncbi:ketopantoate reductase family protein [Candidatus Woesearchaeota archaeon]|nr:ketopantoate reductase family protein [Candidatus Woesearchaeota archaeon]
MILVIGAGPIGTILGSLEGAIIAARGTRLEFLQKNGIILDGKLPLRKEVPVVSAPHELKEKAEFVLICTKSQDTESAILQWKAAVGKETLVVSVSNGWGNEDALAKHIPKDHIIGGVTYIGVQMKEGGSIWVHGAGKTIIGGYFDARLNPRLEHLKKKFEEAGLPCVISEDIKQDIAKKFLVNVGLNATGALFRANNIEVGERPECRALAVSLMEEAIPVLEKEGIQVRKEFIEDFLAGLKALGPNKNSLWADLDKGRKTEIAFLNGAVVALGKKHGIPTSKNEEIVEKIKLLEKN